MSGFEISHEDAKKKSFYERKKPISTFWRNPKIFFLYTKQNEGKIELNLTVFVHVGASEKKKGNFRRTQKFFIEIATTVFPSILSRIE